MAFKYSELDRRVRRYLNAPGKAFYNPTDMFDVINEAIRAVSAKVGANETVMQLTWVAAQRLYSPTAPLITRLIGANYGSQHIPLTQKTREYIRTQIDPNLDRPGTPLYFYRERTPQSTPGTAFVAPWQIGFYPVAGAAPAVGSLVYVTATVAPAALTAGDQYSPLTVDEDEAACCLAAATYKYKEGTDGGIAHAQALAAKAAGMIVTSTGDDQDEEGLLLEMQPDTFPRLGPIFAHLPPEYGYERA